MSCDELVIYGLCLGLHRFDFHVLSGFFDVVGVFLHYSHSSSIHGSSSSLAYHFEAQKELIFALSKVRRSKTDFIQLSKSGLLSWRTRSPFLSLLGRLKMNRTSKNVGGSVMGSMARALSLHSV